jgi:peptide subunit release factor 1 (eRF1)
MRCKECGKEFRQSRWWQEFCTPKCRNDFHNHLTSLALHEAKRAEYAAEVAASAGAKMEVVALSPTQPKLVRRAVVVGTKEETKQEGEQQVA